MGTGCAREIAYFLAKKYQKAFAFMAGWAKVTGLGARAGQRGPGKILWRGWNQMSSWTCSFRSLKGDNVRLPSQALGSDLAALGSGLVPTRSAGLAAHLVPRLHKAILPSPLDPALAYSSRQLWPAGHEGEAFLLLLWLQK